MINLNAEKVVDLNDFESLFIYYYPKVKLFIYGFLKDEESAQDIAQDVFLKLWKHRAELGALTNFNAFLFRCAKNEMLNYVRRLYVETAHIEKERQKEEEYGNDSESEYIATELSSLVKSMVDKMPPQRKLIFKMSRKEGLNNDEIARKLNVSKRTVENHLTIALKTIRKNLLTILMLVGCLKI